MKLEQAWQQTHVPLALLFFLPVISNSATVRKPLAQARCSGRTPTPPLILTSALWLMRHFTTWVWTDCTLKQEVNSNWLWAFYFSRWWASDSWNRGSTNSYKGCCIHNGHKNRPWTYLTPDPLVIFTGNLPESYTVQYPNGTFFGLQQNWAIKPHVQKWWLHSTVLNPHNSDKTIQNHAEDFGGFEMVRV